MFILWKSRPHSFGGGWYIAGGGVGSSPALYAIIEWWLEKAFPAGLFDVLVDEKDDCWCAKLEVGLNVGCTHGPVLPRGLLLLNVFFFLLQKWQQQTIIKIIIAARTTITRTGIMIANFSMSSSMHLFSVQISSPPPLKNNHFASM